MITLPRHLSPWASSLALFPKDIAAVLGPFVARIANLVGKWKVDPSGEGTPDGYGGIASRGTYDRLLVTEWAMLEELPDEFVRRVVSGEHSFLERSYRQEASTKRSVALFDTGIDQLGAPRIAQLAALIVLAQRAEENGAVFEWGIFQDSSAVLHSSVTEVSVLALVEGRSARSVSSSDIERWMTSKDISSDSELYFVGAEEIADHAQQHRASALIVSDVLEPGLPQQIRVCAKSPRLKQVREAVFDVPKGRAAVQLLRDPFAVTVAPRQSVTAKLDAQSNLLVSPDGRRLWARATNGALLTFRIPNSPRAMPDSPSAFLPPNGHVVIAVGQASSKKTLVVTRGNDVAVHLISRRGGTLLDTERYWVDDYPSQPTGADVPLAPLGVLVNRVLCFIDVNGNLVELKNGELKIRDASAVASIVVNSRLGYARIADGLLQVMWAHADPSGKFVTTPLGTGYLSITPTVPEFHFGSLGHIDLIAYSSSKVSWNIVHKQQSLNVHVPPDYSVVGVMDQLPKAKPFLVALNESKNRIELIHATHSEVLLTSSAPIAQVTISNHRNDIIYMTQEGELGVYSCARNAMVLRVAPENMP